MEGANHCGKCQWPGLLQSGGSEVAASPILACRFPPASTPCIGRFDFHEVGDFNLLSEGDGWKWDATFSPAVPEDGDFKGDDMTWTSAVRVVAPNGAPHSVGGWMHLAKAGLGMRLRACTEVYAPQAGARALVWVWVGVCGGVLLTALVVCLYLFV